jgi:hypothetical protein
MGKTLHPLVPYCALRLGGKIRMECGSGCMILRRRASRVLAVTSSPNLSSRAKRNCRSKVAASRFPVGYGLLLPYRIVDELPTNQDLVVDHFFRQRQELHAVL